MWRASVAFLSHGGGNTPQTGVRLTPAGSVHWLGRDRRRWRTRTQTLWGRGMKQSQLWRADAKGRANGSDTSEDGQPWRPPGLCPTRPGNVEGAINVSSQQTPTCVPTVTRRVVTASGKVTARNTSSKSSRRGHWDLIGTHTAGLRSSPPRGCGAPPRSPRPSAQPAPATHSPAPRSARA